MSDTMAVAAGALTVTGVDATLAYSSRAWSAPPLPPQPATPKGTARATITAPLVTVKWRV